MTTPLIISAMAALMAPQEAAPQTPATTLSDVEVTIRAQTDRARQFVERVAAPSRGRGLGRWRHICPAVVNLEPEAAQDIATRIASVASELGIEVEDPGCTANIIVIFTDDAPALTRALVEAQPRVYHVGVSALNRGGAALREFQSTTAPVRWWHMSVPIDSESGQRAIRAPGDPSGGVVDQKIAEILMCNPADCVIGAAPIVRMTSASRLNSQIIDQIYKAIIIVDIDQSRGLTTAQLGDYLTMISLAQIDPDAETGPFDTVLNLFDHPTGTYGLTAWDEAYLVSLYDLQSRRRAVSAQALAVANMMNRTLRDDVRAEARRD